MPNQLTSRCEGASLCDALDRVLNTGVVVAGEVRISLAEIDLIYLAVHLTLTSAETAQRHGLTVTARSHHDSPQVIT